MVDSRLRVNMRMLDGTYNTCVRLLLPGCDGLSGSHWRRPRGDRRRRADDERPAAAVAAAGTNQPAHARARWHAGHHAAHGVRRGTGASAERSNPTAMMCVIPLLLLPGSRRRWPPVCQTSANGICCAIECAQQHVICLVSLNGRLVRSRSSRCSSRRRACRCRCRWCQWAWLTMQGTAVACSRCAP